MTRRIDHAEDRRRRGAQQEQRSEEQLIRDFTEAAVKPLRKAGKKGKPRRRSAWDPEPK